MPYTEFQENIKLFNELVTHLSAIENEPIHALIKSYLEQNIMIINEMLATSIDNLNRLQKARNANDIICTQARFSNEINKKLTFATQRFLNASLGQIADYNEWLKAHCDLATD